MSKAVRPRTPRATNRPSIAIDAAFPPRADRRRCGPFLPSFLPSFEFFVNDIFERIAAEASRLEIQNA